MKVVGQAGNGQELVEVCRECSPDVVIMDVGMPGVNGIRATAWLLEECPDVAVLGLSMHADRRIVEEMLRAGASGYVLKDEAFEELAKAIRHVAEGQIYLSSQVAGVKTSDRLRYYLRIEPRSDAASDETAGHSTCR